MNLVNQFQIQIKFYHNNATSNKHSLVTIFQNQHLALCNLGCKII